MRKTLTVLAVAALIGVPAAATAAPASHTQPATPGNYTGCYYLNSGAGYGEWAESSVSAHIVTSHTIHDQFCTQPGVDLNEQAGYLIDQINDACLQWSQALFAYVVNPCRNIPAMLFDAVQPIGNGPWSFANVWALSNNSCTGANQPYIGSPGSGQDLTNTCTPEFTPAAPETFHGLISP